MNISKIRQTYQQLERLSILELFYRHTWKAVHLMAKFISREKLSKKARKELDNRKRVV